MSEQAKQEEPKIENKQELSELSAKQLEEASGGYFDEFASFRTLSPAAPQHEPDPIPAHEPDPIPRTKPRIG